MLSTTNTPLDSQNGSGAFQVLEVQKPRRDADWARQEILRLGQEFGLPISYDAFRPQSAPATTTLILPPATSWIPTFMGIAWEARLRILQYLLLDENLAKATGPIELTYYGMNEQGNHNGYILHL